MDIYTPEYECGDLNTLILSIRQHLKRHVGPVLPSPTKSDFIALSSELPDIIYGVVSPIARKPIKDHRVLWVMTLQSVVHRANILMKLHKDVQFHSRADSDVAHVVKELSEVLTNLYSFIKSFMAQVDENTFLEANNAYRNTIRTSFISLLCEALELVDTGKDVAYDPEYFEALATVTYSAVVHVQNKKYDQWEHKLTAQADVTKAIVALNKTAFFMGAPEKVEPLFVSNEGRPPVTETFPFNFVSHLETDLPLLIDFYRYCGFCLVTLATTKDSTPHITSKYAQLANYFLVTLLSLPNLSLSNYPISGEVPRTIRSEHYLLLQDREEISFFYVLSYLLRLENLTSLVDPLPRFKAEVKHFVLSFGKRISSDLDILASRNQSYSNSTISMLSLEQRATAAAPIGNANTLSSILSEGTYKEKLHLVKLFFDNLVTAKVTGNVALAKMIETFNFESVPEGSLLTRTMKNQDFHHLLSNVDIQAYPGKRLYVEAIEKIVRLIQLLTLKYLHTTLGLESHPDQLLAQLYNTTYTFDNVSKVKQLLRTNDDGTLCRAVPKHTPENLEISSQLDMISTTRELEQTMR